MTMSTSLLNTSIELKREFGDDQTVYYKLILGTDDETRVVITDQHIENLLTDLPNFLSTVIQSQVLIENISAKEESK